MKSYHYFAVFCLAGYLITLLILGFLPQKDYSYFHLVGRLLLVSVGPLLFISAIAYRLCGRKIAFSINKSQAIRRGITSALVITFFTPMLTFIIYRMYEMINKISALPHPVNFIVESLMFGLGGVIYGLLGSLVFGSLLGISIYSYDSKI